MIKTGLNSSYLCLKTWYWRTILLIYIAVSLRLYTFLRQKSRSIEINKWLWLTISIVSLQYSSLNVRFFYALYHCFISKDIRRATRSFLGYASPWSERSLQLAMLTRGNREVPPQCVSGMSKPFESNPRGWSLRNQLAVDPKPRENMRRRS